LGIIGGEELKKKSLEKKKEFQDQGKKNVWAEQHHTAK